MDGADLKGLVSRSQARELTEQGLAVVGALRGQDVHSFPPQPLDQINYDPDLKKRLLLSFQLVYSSCVTFFSNT